MANPKPALATTEQTVDADTLKKDIDALREDVRTLMTDLGAVAKKSSERGLAQGKDVADQALERATEARSTVEDKVRENPLAAIGIALGAGVLLSALSRR